MRGEAGKDREGLKEKTLVVKIGAVMVKRRRRVKDGKYPSFTLLFCISEGNDVYRIAPGTGTVFPMIPEADIVPRAWHQAPQLHLT